MTIVLDGEDRATINETINWFAEQAYLKFARGVHEHGGVLRHKGGLLREAEMETLDHVIYQQAIRHQLTQIEGWLEAGRVEDALVGLHLLLRGTPVDRMPQ
ncbi:MAG: hypothetical protein NTY02_09350 [Acidobacteria bacterium]|nr:hypothetical protein [Acidobacteriota bacterium]